MNAFLKLPKWLQIVIVIVILIVIYFIYRWVKNKANEGNYNAAVNQSTTALNQLAQQGVTPSYGQGQYTGYANALQQAFDGCSAVWDSDSFQAKLEEVFNAMKNDADVYALIAAYGVRTIDKCGAFTGDFNGDLSATLGYKFSGVEGALIRFSISDLNTILKKNGIVYSF